ncbi:osmotically-inducible lipoprotein OsmE [Pseudomonas frederiksbergensis]|uniref:Cell envelope protein SmpA n=1 Tax=Pseudomonas frederiksbergensis TaxID=104087 RepID=A0A423K788_9PSED|nr:osmotically-inducible lipoprotein OsmE [Pseudomonas frederiksbergensis]RON47624.1 cell envelope protein SmpA [Pseudomonas frederiksbergensis]
MNKPVFAVLAVLAAAGGCSSESSLYRNQPLVAKVENGMTRDQVEQIGGKPLATSDRTVEPGSCYDYNLSQAGHQQRYNVSFDGRGKVDHTSFMSCAEWSNVQQKAREPSHSSSGGGGY